MKQTRQCGRVLNYKYQVSLESDSIRAVIANDFSGHLPCPLPMPSYSCAEQHLLVGRPAGISSRWWRRHTGKNEPHCLHAAEISLPETDIGEGLLHVSLQAHGLCFSCRCLSWSRLKHSPCLLKFLHASLRKRRTEPLAVAGSAEDLLYSWPEPNALQHPEPKPSLHFCPKPKQSSRAPQQVSSKQACLGWAVGGRYSSLVPRAVWGRTRLSGHQLGALHLSLPLHFCAFFSFQVWCLGGF